MKTHGVPLAILVSLTFSGLAAPVTKWAAWLPQETYTSPAIGPDGTIYVGTGRGPGATQSPQNGSLCSFTPDGRTNWILSFPISIQCSPSIGSDGRIYAPTYDGQVRIVQPNGAFTSVALGGYVFASPAIGVDSTVYVCAASNYFNKMFALTADGSVKWIFNMTPLVDWTNAYWFSTAQCSSPAIGPDGTIYVGSVDGNVYAVKPDGTTNWVYPLTGIGTSSVSTTYASPAIGPDGTIYIGADGGVAYAISPDGSTKWKVQLCTDCFLESSAAVANDGTVYFATGKGLVHALDSNGNQRWRYTNSYDYVTSGPAAISASPALASDGSLYLADIAGNFFGVSPIGARLWVRGGGIGVGIFSSPAVASDGTIYYASTRLTALAATNQLQQSLWPMFRGDVRHTARSVQRRLDIPQVLPDGNLVFNVGVEPGRTYSMEYSNDQISWAELTTFVSDTFATEVSDLTATNCPARTYRLRTSIGP